jgi:hypothetical protein
VAGQINRRYRVDHDFFCPRRGVRGLCRSGPPPDQHDLVGEQLAAHEVRRCQTRLLHALAGAAEQGALDEVLDELLDVDGERVNEAITATCDGPDGSRGGEL